MKSIKCNGEIYHTGDRVTCIICHEEIKDAKIYICSPEEFKGQVDTDVLDVAFICQNRQCGAVSPNKLGYTFSWLIYLYYDDYDRDARNISLKKIHENFAANILELAFPTRS